MGFLLKPDELLRNISGVHRCSTGPSDVRNGCDGWNWRPSTLEARLTRPQKTSLCFMTLVAAHGSNACVWCPMIAGESTCGVS